MKRWTLRILLCLILGTISTVAVAWGIAWTHSANWPDSAVRIRGSERDDRREWILSLSDIAGITFVHSWRSRGTLHPEERPYLLDHDPDEISPAWVTRAIDESVSTSALYGDHDGRQLRGYGWPKRAMWCGWQLSTGTATPMEALYAGIKTKKPAHDLYGHSAHVVLPDRIAIEGFVFDTVFYFVIWLVIWIGLFFGFARAKRFIRVRRGRCPRCGYDLRGQREGVRGEPPATSHVRCPECGWGRPACTD